MKSIALILSCLTTSFLAGPAAAQQQSATDTEGDATITLTIPTELYSGLTDWCSVSITVLGNDVDLTAGDTVEVSVWEDDVVGDDLLFSTTHVVTAAEEAAQLVTLTFDCSVDPATIVDTGTSAEIFAEAEVAKAACGAFCFFDRPETNPLFVLLVDPPVEFIRGDANGDGAIDIGDPIAVLEHLFSSVPTSCAAALDANDDEMVNIADGIYTLNALFSSGPLPTAPFPACGLDPTPGTLTCDSSAACP